MAIALLVVLARNTPGTTSPFSSLLQGKSALPCRSNRLKVVQQAMSNLRDKDPFDRITESDVEDAAPDSLIIDASDTEVIDIEYINSRTFNVPYMNTCYSYGI